MVDQQTQVVTLTPVALDKVRGILAQEEAAELGLRVFVRGGGCSGLSYVLQLDDEADALDRTWEMDGVRVVVDSKSAKFLAGTTLRYDIKNLMEGGWVFDNPNAARSCGCGTSFTPR